MAHLLPPVFSLNVLTVMTDILTYKWSMNHPVNKNVIEFDEVESIVKQFLN